MSQKQPGSRIVVQGPGVLGLLGVAFVVLKLCGVIAWSWWWVTLPFWGPFALLIAVMPLIFVAALGVVLAKDGADRRRRKKWMRQRGIRIA